ncbi:putative CoA-transferase [compost metagenome]
MSVSQAETFLTATSEHFLRESLQPGSFVACGNSSEHHAPYGVFPCAGEDQWCVVTVQDDSQWISLLGAIGRNDLCDDESLATAHGRVQRHTEVQALLSAWTRLHTPREVMQILQAAKVPAGFMRRMHEVEGDPHLEQRNFFAVLQQPGLTGPALMENAPVKSLNLPDPDIRPAPFLAEHTHEIASRLLGLSSTEIETLIASGDLEVA